MVHLFYDKLGGVKGTSILSVNNGLVSMFSNIQTSTYYWCETWSPIFDGSLTFSFGYGAIDASNNRTTPCLAWLVRDGDVFAAPAPATLALLGVGPAGLGISRHKR